jgi:DNA-binding NarL/FixJ family response regulator
MNRLLVVADQLPVFESVHRALRQGGMLQIAGVADGRRSIADALATLTPAAVLIDEMQDHADAVARVREVAARPPVVSVVLVGRNSGSVVEDVYEAGAQIVLSRSLHPVAFATILRETMRGTLVLRPRPSRPAPDHGLTSREAEILAAVAEGATNRDIAARLWITEQTVKFHLSNCYRKLGVGNRTQASRYAYDHALLATHEPLAPPHAQLAS